jgi:hypothetical protein
MNERFAVDPQAVRNSAELRMLLNQFGPRAGRYISTLPAAWFEQVRESAKSWTPIESTRASRLLQLAMEDRKVLRERLLPTWGGDRGWLDNIRPLLMNKPAQLAAAVVGDFEEVPPGLPLAVRLGDLALTPGSDERIHGTVDEYRRVCSVLLCVSHEAFMVDPYFDPTRSEHSDVLAALWRDASDGPCSKIVLWALTSKVIDGVRPKTVDDVGRALRKCAPRGVRRSPKILMHLVDDKGSKESMHGRYLLSIHGGVRLERGFQCYTKAKVDVSPVSSHEVLDGLLRLYKDGQHGYRINHTLQAG